MSKLEKMYASQKSETPSIEIRNEIELLFLRQFISWGLSTRKFLVEFMIMTCLLNLFCKVKA